LDPPRTNTETELRMQEVIEDNAVEIKGAKAQNCAGRTLDSWYRSDSLCTLNGKF
jgi:hypothetical protein